MSWIADNLAHLVNVWNGVQKVKHELQKTNNPIRIGVLSAAKITGVALVDPIDTHPDVVLSAIAARSLSKAEAQVRKLERGPSCRAYGSYDDLLRDPDIDAVYLPLPNGLHFEWAIKAMKAGKHVLIEKPIAANAGQVAEIQKVAKETSKVALEAFHWRLHPATQAVKAIVDNGKYGNVVSIHAHIIVPSCSPPAKDDIRFQYSLAGGASMGLAYVHSCSCYFAGATKDSEFDVKSAIPRINVTDSKIDDAMKTVTEIRTPGKPPVAVITDVDECPPPIWGLIPTFPGAPTATITLEKAKIEFANFMMPGVFHRISITESDGKKHTKKYYKGGEWGERGEEWYSTYRWQLEAFVDRIRGRDGPWVSLDESAIVMRLVDSIYEKAGLSKRGLDR